MSEIGSIVFLVPVLNLSALINKHFIDLTDMLLHLLTSSMRTPKIIREQWGDTLMPFHEHSSIDGLLVPRQSHLYCHYGLGEFKNFVHSHVYICGISLISSDNMETVSFPYPNITLAQSNIRRIIHSRFAFILFKSIN